MFPLAMFSYHCDYIKEPVFILIIILRLSLFDVLSFSFSFFYYPDLDRAADEPFIKIPRRRGQLTFEGAIVPPSGRGCRGTMIVGKEDVDPYGAPTLHYVRPRPPRACLVLSVFYGHFEHGVAPCGGIISGIQTSSRTAKSREKKYMRYFFPCPQAIISHCIVESTYMRY